MLAISANDGTLCIFGEIPIPSAEAGQWSEARIGKLMELIKETVDAAELVDSAAKEIPRYAKTSGSVVK